VSLLVVHTYLRASSLLRQYDKEGVCEPLPRLLPGAAAPPAGRSEELREGEALGPARWQALSPAAKAKRKALLIPVFTYGRGGARTWVPATLEPDVTEAAVQDFMTFVLMDRDIACNASTVIGIMW